MTSSLGFPAQRLGSYIALLAMFFSARNRASTTNIVFATKGFLLLSSRSSVSREGFGSELSSQSQLILYLGSSSSLHEPIEENLVEENEEQRPEILMKPKIKPWPTGLMVSVGV